MWFGRVGPTPPELMKRVYRHLRGVAQRKAPRHVPFGNDRVKHALRAPRGKIWPSNLLLEWARHFSQ